MGRRVRRVHGILHAQNARTLRMQTWSIVYDFRPGETDDEVLCEHLNLSLPHLRSLFWMLFFFLAVVGAEFTYEYVTSPGFVRCKNPSFCSPVSNIRFFFSLSLYRPTTAWALLKCIKMIVKCVCATYLSLCLALGILEYSLVMPMPLHMACFFPPAAMGSTFCAATALMSVMMNTECGIDAVAAAKRWINRTEQHPQKQNHSWNEMAFTRHEKKKNYLHETVINRIAYDTFTHLESLSPSSSLLLGCRECVSSAFTSSMTFMAGHLLLIHLFMCIFRRFCCRFWGRKL